MVEKENKELCTICDSEIEVDNGDTVGTFGMTPIAFCVWCLSSITDMVIKLNGFNDVEVLQGIIEDLKEKK